MTNGNTQENYFPWSGTSVRVYSFAVASQAQIDFREC